MPFYEKQLQFMIDLANSRPDWLNPFFRLLNYLDTPYFFLALIPFAWFALSYKWGLRIFYWSAFGSIINAFAKSLVGWSRPCVDCPQIALEYLSSKGFPSGAAQTCVFLGALLIYYWRTRAAWIIGISYILLQSFSRLYLGVHYPIDILGGWAIGALLFLLFIKVEARLEKFLVKRGLLFSFFLVFAIPCTISLLFPHRNIVTHLMAAALGIGTGACLSLHYRLFLPAAKTFSEGLARSIFGIGLTFLVIALWPDTLPHATRAFGGAFFMSFVASPIYKKLFLAR